MKITNLRKIGSKDLIVFDLDGTLARSKTPMDREMCGLLERLLAEKRVAVIGGGKYALFQEQLLKPLKVRKDLLARLFLFPTTATAFYQYKNGWKNVYAHTLSAAQKKRIRKAFEDAFVAVGYTHPKKTYGPLIEDRGTQMTFSALGQEIVATLGTKRGVALKEKWKRAHTKDKLAIAKHVRRALPGLEVNAAGHTSVDVTKKGIDKSYGMRQIQKYLKVRIPRMLFVGDAIFPGGNDYPATKTGVDYVAISGPEETKKVIRAVLGES